MVHRGSPQIRRMFSSVAHRYDLLNHVLSLSIDRWWRYVTRQELLRRLPAAPLVLDLCTGTGDLALELSRRTRVVGCDFCHPMLVRALVKSQRRGRNGPVRWVEGDALRLPFPASCFDGATVAFGLRNLEDYRSGLSEMLRVLKPGGWLAVLEFSLPTLPVVRPAYLFYFTRVLPRLGRLVSGQEGPYSYLPQSVQEFPEPAELQALMREVGFVRCEDVPLSLRIATLTLGLKQGAAPAA